jgi:hypothetical protein
MGFGGLLLWDLFADDRRSKIDPTVFVDFIGQRLTKHLARLLTWEIWYGEGKGTMGLNAYQENKSPHSFPFIYLTEQSLA